MDLTARAKELLESLEYINIATVSADGQPWNTPVYARYDSELNFYWSSWMEAEHSKNIRTSPTVFITLYDSTRKRGDNHQRCLYLQATAIELAESDTEVVDMACNLLYGNDDTVPTAADYSGEQVKRIYKATPEQAWLNDKSERQVTKETIKMRVEVPLEELKN